MAGTVLENLSGRKLIILTSILLILQITCFLIGGLIVRSRAGATVVGLGLLHGMTPAPSSPSPILGTKCYDSQRDRTRWLYARGAGQCNQIGVNYPQGADAGNIVFTFQLPIPKGGINLDYSRWQQNLIGILQFEIKYERDNPIQPETLLKLDARMGYRNRGDKDSDWKLYAESVEERQLECFTEGEPIDEHNYHCGLIPLFELGSLHHDFYLLNIRLPTNKVDPHNQKIGKIEEIHMITIHQNGGFTQIWLSLKTCFTPIVLAVIIWFWNRVKQQGRPPALLENMILALGIAVELLNCPIEWLSLFFDMPYMLLLSDIRQGIFYSALLSFWLVFAGEHLMESGGERPTIRNYWKHLSAVVVGCSALFLFDLCERGTHLVNPFYSLWATPVGTKLALVLIVAAGISACLYFVFLCWMIWKVFCNISAKRTTLPAMSAVRRLHYQGIIYRFKFLMLTTLVCAAMTVIGFILGQVTEDKWKWEGGMPSIEYTSAFYTGVYGMWNIYILALLCLYAPSHKSWPPERDPYANGSEAEEIEFTRLDPDTTEISAIASFAKKVAAD